ncbi:MULTISPECIES: LysR family transcriptional regulator [Bacillus]|uniref:LysR family transcriptional regulator n=1 Tax=Bacillus TaxID=1386 RepID=UPI002550FA8A|nr:LysR family transcriptional regulator [Bacillus sp. lyk4-R2A-2]
MYYDALKTFVTVVEEKNFTKAAQKLRISQPSVSLHIKNLEQEFQTVLLNRSPKQLTVTPTGDMLYHRSKQIIRLYEQAKQDIYEHHHLARGKLTIGASFTIGEYVLPQILAEFHQLYPHVDIEVVIDNTEAIASHVRLFHVDIGLIEGQTNDKELTVETFLEDELYIVAPLDHPFAKKKDVTIDQLQNETWITREEGSGTGEYLQHVLKSNGLKARTFVTFSSNQAIKEAVIHGMGLSVLSKYVLQRGSIGGELAVISVRGMDFKRKFSYVESPMTGGNKNKELFVELLRKERKDASPQ